MAVRKGRLIFHIDMDAYFASVEIAANPSLAGKPVVVVSSDKIGVVTAASYQARRYGISSGMPLFKARMLCGNLSIVVGEPEKYMFTTKMWFQYLKRFSDTIELYSIDEVFIDMTGSLHLFGTPIGLARAIKDEMLKRFKLPCSIGIAKNRLLAKIASKLAKPSGIFQISEENMDDILLSLPLEDFPGIGKKIRQKLLTHQISNTASLRRADTNLLESLFGRKEAEKLHNISCGIDNSEVSAKPVKSVGKSTTLTHLTRNRQYINAIIMKLSYQVAWRLKEKGLKGSIVTIYLRFRRHHSSYSMRIENPTNQADIIYSHCVMLVSKVSKPIRSVGISVSELTESSTLYLFEEGRKSNRIEHEIYRINRRFGQFTIYPAELMKVKDSCMLKPHGFLSKAIPDTF